nr:NUDIX domain-containing protein [Microlunatus sagamiharensis]
MLGHRHPARRWYPDCWDLFGGHVEPGESPEQAARRVPRGDQRRRARP